jgi:hypothetical protein
MKMKGHNVYFLRIDHLTFMERGLCSPAPPLFSDDILMSPFYPNFSTKNFGHYAPSNNMVDYTLTNHHANNESYQPSQTKHTSIDMFKVP